MAGAIKRNFLFGNSFAKWVYNISGFNRHGLYRDDAIQEFEEVKIALDRLPKHIVDERNFRLIRAMVLDSKKIPLPKEEWIKFEEDKLYLTPYLKEVERELKEKRDWDRE